MTMKIALLATGDELTNGDVLNTNGQRLAQILFDHAMIIGRHMMVSDDPAEIQAAITDLLKTHDALIITGGLGPTSDDLTRFALAAALNTPLVFDEATWAGILALFERLQLKNQPESNRQQALFPEGARILANPYGTAAGCWLEQGGKYIAMLPGPPGECLPMFETYVLAALEAAGFQSSLQYANFLLFGPSEGQIAEVLDDLAQPFQVRTGYRLHYPYVEFKVYAEVLAEFEAYLAVAQKIIAPYLLGFGTQTALEALRAKLLTLPQALKIFDEATKGHLQAALVSPETYTKIIFTDQAPDLHLQGLTEFWQARETPETLLHFNGREVKLPHRGKRTLSYVLEWIAWQIVKTL